MSHPVATHEHGNSYPSDHYKPVKHKLKALHKAKSGSIGESVSKLQRLLASKPSDFLGK